MKEMGAAADDLVLLVEVVEAGGFSAASARCGIPKSRLSRRIAPTHAPYSSAARRRSAADGHFARSAPKAVSIRQDQ